MPMWCWVTDEDGNEVDPVWETGDVPGWAKGGQIAMTARDEADRLVRRWWHYIHPQELREEFKSNIEAALLAERKRGEDSMRERAAVMAAARAIVWKEREFSGVQGVCALSLEEECEDIATAIRALPGDTR
jgi:hypothetical protein